MATQDTQIRLYGEPRPIPPDRVMAEPVTALLVAGIVNPLGPTFNAVVVAGKIKTGAKLPVVRLMLNPFRQEVEAVGELAIAQNWHPSDIIRPLFGLPFGDCPSLLLPSVHLDHERSVSLHAEFLRGFNGARGMLERVKQYFGNSLDRVSQEMSVATDQLVARHAGLSAATHRLPKSLASDSVEVATEPLNEQEAKELAELLLSERHTKSELPAFVYAWDGSINFYRERGLAALADGAMTRKTFLDISGCIVQSCRVPELGQVGPQDVPDKVVGTRKSASNSGCYLLSIALISGLTILGCGGLIYFRSLSNAGRTSNSAPIRFESPQQAVVQFANGERYLGTLNSLNSKEITFQVAGQPQMARLPANTVKYVQTSQVVYIFNPQTSGFETAQPQQANLSMMNGQQFTGTLFSLTSNEVIFQVAGQQEIAVVPGNTVREVQTAASRHIYNVTNGVFEKQ